MPSSHSQFMFFFAAFGTFWLLMRVRTKGRPELPKPWATALKLAASLGMFSVASVVAFSRVYLKVRARLHLLIQKECLCAIISLLVHLVAYLLPKCSCLCLC